MKRVSVPLFVALALSPKSAARAERNSVIEVRRETPFDWSTLATAPARYLITTNGQPQVRCDWSELSEWIEQLGPLTWEPVFEDEGAEA